MTKVKFLLEKAKDLLEKGWTTGAFARDGTGFATAISSKNATCFCAMGAIERAARDNNLYVEGEAEAALSRAIFKMEGRFAGIPEFNDKKTKQEVLQAFDNAIKDCDK